VQALITDSLLEAEPAFDGLRQLKNATSWMVGAQFYFSEELAICEGHVAYPSAPWALSSVSQRNFWQANMDAFGDGSVKDILSVDISDWETKAPSRNGSTAKAARECTTEEVLDEVWQQLKEALGDKLPEAKLVKRRLDDNVVFTAGKADNNTPLLVHPPGSWFHRPSADLRIENLFLASDYVKTNTDLASMEGANEAARRAVNALLEIEKSAAPPCEIWSMEEGLGPLVAVAKLLDRDLYLIEESAPIDLGRFEGALASLYKEPPVTMAQLEELEKRIVTALKLIRRT
jgi:hypothetical protein